VEIRAQPTPNPNAMKFTVDRTVVDGRASRSFHSAAHVAEDPLARALFAVAGVASLFMVEDFITVTKQPDAQWHELAPQLEAAILAALG
jgi:hypothetical protein